MPHWSVAIIRKRVRSYLAAFRDDERMKRPDTPFPKHWFYYIVLKYAVIAAAILIALYVAFQLL